MARCNAAGLSFPYVSSKGEERATRGLGDQARAPERGSAVDATTQSTKGIYTKQVSYRYLPSSQHPLALKIRRPAHSEVVKGACHCQQGSRAAQITRARHVGRNMRMAGVQDIGNNRREEGRKGTGGIQVELPRTLAVAPVDLPLEQSNLKTWRAPSDGKID